MKNLEKPNMGSNFTVDDIHKIREYHHGLTKDMSFTERRDFFKNRADEILKTSETTAQGK